MEFTITATFPTSPEQLYECWLNSEKHSAMTGAEADCSDAVGGIFSAWDGYIEGRNLELTPGRRIVQSWRSADFLSYDPNSRVEITLEPVQEGTLLTLRHSEIPEDQPDYRAGWEEFYFEPMESYFAPH